jgi:L-seryl-tRNA(Ser) seleniumtransferase
MRLKTNLQNLFKQIPSVQVLLQDPDLNKYDIDVKFLKKIIQDEIRLLRTRLSRSSTSNLKNLSGTLRNNILDRLKTLNQPSLKRVVNATGIILHTNLGRAPIPPEARGFLMQIIENYNNLELNLNTGQRGNRDDHVEELVCLLTGAEAALIVNNNAAAVLLTLNSLANRKEVPVSRGELVEIGGSYRMPDVMKASGVKMIEVGTTNKTHLKDYEERINKKTAALLKVHTSNYRIMGFTQSVSLESLVALARKYDLPLIYDMGSGALVDLSKYGVEKEPIANEIIDMGVDVVTFSGDKILGGPQSGIIIGRGEYIKKIKKNSLTRALRCDKLTYAILEMTLKIYLNSATISKRIPVFEMLNISLKNLRSRATEIQEKVTSSNLEIQIEKSISQMGSGALPLEEIPSISLRISSKRYSASNIAKRLCENDTPIIGYIREENLFLNLRTIRSDEIPIVIKAMNQI